MSSIHSQNRSYTYSRLSNRNLEKGCGTGHQRNPWMQATFDGIVHITTVEIGACSVSDWGEYINGAVLEKHENKKWVRVIKIVGITANSIQSIKVNIKTDAIRLCMKSKTYLGVGYLQFSGPKVPETDPKKHKIYLRNWQRP
eukprot:UN07242